MTLVGIFQDIDGPGRAGARPGGGGAGVLDGEHRPDRRRVLVVAAAPAVRRAARAALEGAGLAVEVAADGEEALARMGARRPDLLVLDAALPGIAPRVVAAAVRAAFGESVPLVLLAPAGRGPELARQLRAAGWVATPPRPDELAGAVRAGLRPKA